MLRSSGTVVAMLCASQLGPCIRCCQLKNDFSLQEMVKMCIIRLVSDNTHVVVVVCYFIDV